MDGLIGPMLSGTCFYMKRKALYGTAIHKGIAQSIKDLSFTHCMIYFFDNRGVRVSLCTSQFTPHDTCHLPRVTGIS